MKQNKIISMRVTIKSQYKVKWRWSTMEREAKLKIKMYTNWKRDIFEFN